MTTLQQRQPLIRGRNKHVRERVVVGVYLASGCFNRMGRVSAAVGKGVKNQSVRIKDLLGHKNVLPSFEDTASTPQARQPIFRRAQRRIVLGNASSLQERDNPPRGNLEMLL